MNNNPPPELIQLEDSSIWQDVCAIAEKIYVVLPALPEEEKWNLGAKLRQSANDAMYFTAYAVGNTSPTGNEYDWGQTRKCLAALKTLYRFCGRLKFTQIDPDIMLTFDDLQKRVDAEVKKAHEKTEAYQKNDLQHWRKKYELAQKAYKLQDKDEE